MVVLIYKKRHRLQIVGHNRHNHLIIIGLLEETIQCSLGWHDL